MESVRLGVLGVRERYRVAPDAVRPDDLVGFAAGFSVEDLPVNGLRHPRTAVSCGWYIWSSEAFAVEPDAFVPTHVRHVLDLCPGIEEYLALPPGWRFLIAPGYEDVWYDDSLLDV